MNNLGQNTWTLVAAGDFFQDKFLEFMEVPKDAKHKLGKIVAVDEGLKYLDNCGVKPDFCIGDFDSLGYIPEIGEVKTYPSDKDLSDTELALNLAIKSGADIIKVFGAMGGPRPEHSIANLHIFSRYPGMVTIYDSRATYIFADKTHPVKILEQNAEVTYVSLFPFAGPCEGVCATGLKYELDNDCLKPGSSLGLSNEYLGAEAKISVKKGTLLIVISNKAER